jgi:hypothetical protein
MSIIAGTIAIEERVLIVERVVGVEPNRDAGRLARIIDELRALPGCARERTENLDADAGVS